MGNKNDGHKKFFANYKIQELGDSRIRRDDSYWIFMQPTASTVVYKKVKKHVNNLQRCCTTLTYDRPQLNSLLLVADVIDLFANQVRIDLSLARYNHEVTLIYI